MKIRYAWARRASQNQRDVLLAFASVLDKKLDAIGHSAALPPPRACNLSAALQAG